MSWQERALADFKLYAVTDLKPGNMAPFLRKAESAMKSGLQVLQLRSKALSDAELYRVGAKLRQLTRRYRCLFFVNDRPDLARMLDADGVHLGQDDVPVSWARKILANNKKFVGKSTHSVRQAFATSKEPVDYIGFGPIFSTPTKPTYKPIGLNDIQKVKSRVKIPIVAIGGISAKNLGAIIDAGAQRVAVVRAVWDNVQPGWAVKEINERLR